MMVTFYKSVATSKEALKKEKLNSTIYVHVCGFWRTLIYCIICALLFVGLCKVELLFVPCNTCKTCPGVTRTLEKDAQVCNCSVTINSPEVSTFTTSFGKDQPVMEHMKSCTGSTVQRGPVT